MDKEITLKNWILVAMQNSAYSERLEKEDLFLSEQRYFVSNKDRG